MAGVDFSRQRGISGLPGEVEFLCDARDEGGNPEVVKTYIQRALDLNPKNADARNLVPAVEKWEKKLLLILLKF